MDTRTRAASLRRNQYGQQMGAKGELTRARLLACTLDLIGTTALRDLRIAEIARTANTSAATFYLYFEDVAEAVLALAQAQSQATPALLAMVERPWDRAEAMDRAGAFVSLYVETWTASRALYRVRNLAADEGDRRFIDVRYQSVKPLMEALSRVIAQVQVAGAIPQAMDADSTAAALLAMLDRLAAVPNYRPEDVHAELLRSAAFFAACALSYGAAAGRP